MVYNLNAFIQDWFVAITSATKDENLSNWGLIKLEKGFRFVYGAGDVSAPLKTIIVKEDMSMELRVDSRLASFPIMDRLTCFYDVVEILKTVRCLNICMGTEGEGNCPKIYFVRKPHSSSERCQECQIKHRQEMNRIKLREVRLKKKLTKEAKIKKNMKQKIKRSGKKISLLKTEINSLIKNCTPVRTAKLDECVE